MGNPLLKRAIRFHLRHSLTSPVSWFVIIAVASTAAGLASGALQLRAELEALRSGELRSLEDLSRLHVALSRSRMRVLLGVIQSTSLLAPFLLGMAIAWDWARDRWQGVRESICTAPFTIRQLMGARVYPWTVFLLSLCVVEIVGYALLEHLKSSALPLEIAEWMPDLSLAAPLWLPLALTGATVFVFADVGLATRCALGGWHPIAVGLVTLTHFASMMYIPEVWNSVTAAASFGSGAFNPPAHLACLSIDLVIALLTWRGLAARIARDYPLAP